MSIEYRIIPIFDYDKIKEKYKPEEGWRVLFIFTKTITLCREKNSFIRFLQKWF